MFFVGFLTNIWTLWANWKVWRRRGKPRHLLTIAQGIVEIRLLMLLSPFNHPPGAKVLLLMLVTIYRTFNFPLFWLIWLHCTVYVQPPELHTKRPIYPMCNTSPEPVKTLLSLLNHIVSCISSPEVKLMPQEDWKRIDTKLWPRRFSFNHFCLNLNCTWHD